MKRSYLMRRPNEDEDYYGTETVHAKPIDDRIGKRLGDSYKGKDFVKGSEQTQQQFYGEQNVVNSKSRDFAESSTSQLRPLTHDERNKISAKIIKAELKQNNELVNKLKKKLEIGMIETNPTANEQTSEDNDSLLLLKMDKKSGIVMPARSNHSVEQSGSKEKEKIKTVDYEFNRKMELNDMVSNEKMTSSNQQLMMFNQAAKMCSDNKVDDDWIVDDNIMSHSKKKRHSENEEKKIRKAQIEEHKHLERTLKSCKLCMDSPLFEKHVIVAIGLKTYLAVVNWDGLSEDHCYIAPIGHYTSSILLDEDVYEEMKLWQKGLVAMWKNSEEGEHDCIFIETVKDSNEQSHMFIECIPIPRELGDLAPIYFKKAILESEKEWNDNKKLIELSKHNGDIRKAIPKGFPYFSVNFGLQPGYVHLIENDSKFSSYFAQEIVGGMLDLPHNKWRNAKKMSFDEVKQKRDLLREKWKKYDWTNIVKEAIKNTE